jgi:hypothetical protein
LPAFTLDRCGRLGHEWWIVAIALVSLLTSMTKIWAAFWGEPELSRLQPSIRGVAVRQDGRGDRHHGGVDRVQDLYGRAFDVRPRVEQAPI